MFVDHPMRLRYYFKGHVTDAGFTHFNTDWYDDWLASMMSDDVIFFLTAEISTTDVFEKEWDFNDYAYPMLPGVDLGWRVPPTFEEFTKE